MPDHTWRQASLLTKAGYRGEVLGLNERGQVAPTPVLGTFSHGTSTNWLKIEVSRLGIGRGNSSSAVTVTPEHQVYSPDHELADSAGYISASDLRSGDAAWLHRTEVTLPPLAEQVLIGKMLGDGSIANSSTRACGITWSHKADKREYTEWAMHMLGPELCPGPVDERFTSGYGTPMARATTVASCLIHELFEDWRTPQGKQVPASAIDKIGPIALAFWYMDDGSLVHHSNQEDRALFATCSFNERSVDNLVKALERNGIKGAVKYQSSGWRIRLNADTAERLFLLVAPYVPTDMQYKLPERYRMGEAGFPRTFGAYKPLIRPQTVLRTTSTTGDSRGRVTAKPRGSRQYGLWTELGNYFANGMLVRPAYLARRGGTEYE